MKESKNTHCDHCCDPVADETTVLLGVIQEKVAEIISLIDFSKSNLLIFLRGVGDESRYHEIISLDRRKGEWLLHESYLTPEHVFQRSTKLPGFTEATAASWLEALYQMNPLIMNENHSCPKDGLFLPDCIDTIQD